MTGAQIVGEHMGFRITHAPEFIGEFKVVQALSRGFYSAVYQVTYGALDANYVLKVAPKKIYETFKDYGKDFEHERAGSTAPWLWVLTTWLGSTTSSIST